MNAVREENLAPYLKPTFFIDSDSPVIREFAEEATRGANTPAEKASRLYYAVRDRVRYDPYSSPREPEGFKASTTLKNQRGFCVPKAILLAAAARAVGIPARLGFADVRNHLTTERLKERMNTDLFVYHGYTELFVEGRWVKATPTFNLSLCEKFGVKPLDFDGKRDAIFHPFDQAGNRHMEYVKDRGTYADLPLEDLLAAWQEVYGRSLWGDENAAPKGNFEKEAEEDRRMAGK